MTRQYNQTIVDRNVSLFASKKGVKRNIQESPEVMKIQDKGKTRYHYFICFNYDVRDGEIVSCGSRLPKELVNEFKTGVIGRAWIEVERDSHEKEPRIRKITGYDRSLRLIKLESEDEYHVGGIATEAQQPNVNETTRFASNNLLETILHFNHLQRQKRNQGVRQ